jgi:DNA-directed RNA polymerase I, II, and III subunit RPABC2
MADENDDFDNDLTDANDYTEEDDDIDVVDINLDEEDKNEENVFKLMTYKNVLENISKKEKKTIPILTKFERARIMGVRLQQLAYGAKPRVNTENLKSINEIVNKELEERKIPFIIRRTLPNSTYEDWKLEEFISV